jgi:hypothetical protein
MKPKLLLENLNGIGLLICPKIIDTTPIILVTLCSAGLTGSANFANSGGIASADSVLVKSEWQQMKHC